MHESTNDKVRPGKQAKYDNILRDPRVAISVTDQANQYNMVAVRGKAVEHTTNGADTHIDKMAKNFGLDTYPYRAAGEKRVILKVKPTKIFQMKYG